MDKRNLATKEAIKKALIRLSKTKPYTEISIRELCQEADISRSSFYNNYHFFNDVIQEMSEDFMNKLHGKSLSREFFDEIIQNADEVKLLLESGIFGRDFSLYLKDRIMQEVSLPKDKGKSDLLLNVMTLYHAYGIWGVMLNLVENIGSPQFDLIYETAIAALVKMMQDFSLT